MDSIFSGFNSISLRSSQSRKDRTEPAPAPAPSYTPQTQDCLHGPDQGPACPDACLEGHLAPSPRLHAFVRWGHDTSAFPHGQAADSGAEVAVKDGQIKQPCRLFFCCLPTVFSCVCLCRCFDLTDERLNLSVLPEIQPLCNPLLDLWRLKGARIPLEDARCKYEWIFGVPLPVDDSAE